MFPPTLYGILLYICTYNAQGCTFTYTVYVYATCIHFFLKNKAWRLHCICVCLYVCVSRCLSLYVFIYGERESFFFLLQVFFSLFPPLFLRDFFFLVCMYIYVCMYVCIYDCIHVCVAIHVCMHTHICKVDR